MVKLVGVLLSGLVTSLSFASEVDRKIIAEYFAPAVLQEVGRFPLGDIPTRFDFDGDFLADNNWDNLLEFPIYPLVYYEVVETRTHFFVTYAFYRPRDFSNYFFCFKILCHENDLEGAIVTVRKNENIFGHIELVEALAHLSVSSSERPFTYLGRSTHKTGVNQRVVLRIESGGHGIHIWDGKYPKKFDLYLPQDDESKPRIDKLPIHYGLIPIRQLWDLRNHPQKKRIFKGSFDFTNERISLVDLPRSFAGKKFGNDLVALPWSWGGIGLKRGQWFLDPAGWVKKQLRNPSNFSLEYVDHPYLSLTPSSQ